MIWLPTGSPAEFFTVILMSSAFIVAVALLEVVPPDCSFTITYPNPVRLIRTFGFVVLNAMPPIFKLAAVSEVERVPLCPENVALASAVTSPDVIKLLNSDRSGSSPGRERTICCLKSKPLRGRR